MILLLVAILCLKSIYIVFKTGLYPRDFLCVELQDSGRSIAFMDLRIYIDFQYAFHTTINNKLDDKKMAKLNDF